MSSKTPPAATAKCPVCDYVLNDDKQRVEASGRVFLVCCEECAEKVKADPMKYVKAR